MVSKYWRPRNVNQQATQTELPWNTGSLNVLYWQLPGYISLGPQMYLWTSSRTSQVHHTDKEVSLRLLWRVCQSTTTRTTTASLDNSTLRCSSSCNVSSGIQLCGQTYQHFTSIPVQCAASWKTSVMQELTWLFGRQQYALLTVDESWCLDLQRPHSAAWPPALPAAEMSAQLIYFHPSANFLYILYFIHCLLI